MSIKPLHFLGFIAVGIALIVTMAFIFGEDDPNVPRTAGGGDPYGCYVSKLEYESARCADIVQSDIDRVKSHQAAGAMCQKYPSNWICTGDAIVIIPHGDRFK